MVKPDQYASLLPAGRHADGAGRQGVETAYLVCYPHFAAEQQKQGAIHKLRRNVQAVWCTLRKKNPLPKYYEFKQIRQIQIVHHVSYALNFSIHQNLTLMYKFLGQQNINFKSFIFQKIILSHFKRVMFGKTAEIIVYMYLFKTFLVSIKQLCVFFQW